MKGVDSELEENTSPGCRAFRTQVSPVQLVTRSTNQDLLCSTMAKLEWSRLLALFDRLFRPNLVRDLNPGLASTKEIEGPYRSPPCQL